MYGTVARLRLKPGMEERMHQFNRDFESAKVPGWVADYVYRMDADANDYYLVVIFDTREAYAANANSPEQHARYLHLLEMIEGEPEWHDGEIVRTYGRQS